MPSPRRRPIALRSGFSPPSLGQFLDGAHVDVNAWPFEARVLLSKALVRRQAGMDEAAAIEYRAAIEVAARAQETPR